MPDSKITMTSSRPYLVRAFNEWILDNDCTPYIVVDAGVQGVQVPTEHVANGQIVLNISPGAVRGLVIGNGALEFSARFGGVPMQVFIKRSWPTNCSSSNAYSISCRLGWFNGFIRACSF